jgi:hypothetical protein
MDSQSKEVLRIYMDMLNSPAMRWVTWISIAIVFVVCGIAWKKGLSVWKWFLYAVLLGPVALVHILFKSDTHGPSESSRGL